MVWGLESGVVCGDWSGDPADAIGLFGGLGIGIGFWTDGVGESFVRGEFCGATVEGAGGVEAEGLGVIGRRFLGRVCREAVGGWIGVGVAGLREVWFGGVEDWRFVGDGVVGIEWCGFTVGGVCGKRVEAVGGLNGVCGLSAWRL